MRTKLRYKTTNKHTQLAMLQIIYYSTFYKTFEKRFPNFAKKNLAISLHTSSHHLIDNCILNEIAKFVENCGNFK